MGVGKFWPDLEIPEVLMVCEVLFSGDFCVSESQFFFLLMDLGFKDLSFFPSI